LRSRICLLVTLLGLVCIPVVAADSPSQISLDTSETLFATLAALNACGYDQDLTISDAQRVNIRSEIQKNMEGSAEAQAALATVCDYVNTHAAKDPAHNLSQYVSLALYLQGPPQFLPRVKDDEMPPDAAPLSGFGAVLEKFYDKANLHGVWDHHRRDYAEMVDRYHDALAKMVFDTEIYLKLPSSGYLGRGFTIYLDFLGSPNQTNARNYGTEYYVVVFPTPAASGAPPESALKMDQIRHTFLHYVLDPMAERHFSSIKRLEPLLLQMKRAPVDDNFRTDMSLLVTECLVRAIEIRTSGNKQTAEAMRTQAVEDAVKQGYILTRYFYDTLVTFEKDPAGLRNAYEGFLDNIDLKKEEKAASEVQFASGTAPELLQLSRPEDRRMLIAAEKRLAAGDIKGAQELAQQAIDKKIGDQGRAHFILAEVAVANKDMPGARAGFEKVVAEAREPKIVGWSHVYLGRILDLQEDRDAAVVEYRAALTTASEVPEVKAAAEKGLEQPYEPPAKPQPQ